MSTNGINAQGFVTRYFVCGPFLSEPRTELRDKNQLRFEKKLRAEIAAGDEIAPESGVALGADAFDGQKWRLNMPGNDWFIDMSTFYHLLTRVEARAYTRLLSDRDRTVTALCWTYTAADVWLNGERILKNTPAVYKPIKRHELALPLKKGENELYIRMQTLGARDTRTLLALQLTGDFSGVSVDLPGGAEMDEICAREDWLRALRAENGKLISRSVPPAGTRILDLEHSGAPDGIAWERGTEFTLAPDAHVFTVNCDSAGTKLSRRFELFERGVRYGLSPEADYESRVKRLCHGPQTENLPMTAIMHYENGTNTDADYQQILQFLDVIDSRADCSDFYFNALFRLMKKFELPAELLERFRHTALNYRYWMDEDGADGMCFWSENHALLFYSNQYLAGGMYPDDVFVRSGLTGREARARGRERCLGWLKDVSACGFEEFASSSYAVVTACALLSLIDYGEAELQALAKTVLDGLIRQMALHVFDGAVIAPQGRAYRGVLFPQRQASTALMNLCLPHMRNVSSNWLCAFALSEYKIPADAAEIAARDRDMRYACGNAEIHVRKTKDYMLTSCASPRTLDGGWQRVSEGEAFSNEWIRTLNERFHGTTLIRPGVDGYQQHLMYAAVSSEAASFVTHPGGTSDMSQMRPGYWNGNGEMPAIVQKGARVGLVYSISEAHPVSFTHVFFPACRFDETRADGHYLFGRVKDGYMAVWMSGDAVPFDDLLTGCEYRVYGRTAAYLYTMGSRDESGGFEQFIEKVKNAPVSFDGTTLRADDLEVTFTRCTDASQVV